MAKKQSSDPVAAMKAATASLRAIAITLRESKALKADLAALRARNEALAAGLRVASRSRCDNDSCGSCESYHYEQPTEEELCEASALLEVPDA